MVSEQCAGRLWLGCKGLCFVFSLIPEYGHLHSEFATNAKASSA